MNWIPVTSSSLINVRYDETSQTLEIEFKGGRIYQYFDVPIQIFEGLIHADSKGTFFHSNIKGHYRYVRV